MTASSEAGSGFIPKERMTAWERWEMAALAETQAEQAGARKAQAEKDAAEHSAAYALGLEEGRRAGLAAGAAQARAEAERIARCATEAEQALAAMGAGLAGRSVSLALAIARKLVGEEIAARPDAVLGAVKDALAQLPEGGDRVVLNLHPEDARVVGEQLSAEIARGGWRILEDAQMTRGGCRLATAAGDVDATIEARWNHIAAALGVESSWAAR